MLFPSLLFLLKNTFSIPNKDHEKKIGNEIVVRRRLFHVFYAYQQGHDAFHGVSSHVFVDDVFLVHRFVVVLDHYALAVLVVVD